MRAIVLLLVLLAADPVQAQTTSLTPAKPIPVDMALVLVSDVSRSIDDGEFKLQKDGYTEAFADRRVLAAIQGGPIGAIAVAYVEFAGASEARTVMDWHIVKDAASARAMTRTIAAAERSYWGRTSVSAGIDHAVQVLAEAPFEVQRRVIDVAGDGVNNSGRDASDARDDALKAGIIINGLAIINDHPANYTFLHVQPPGGLTGWYRRNVIGGPGSFALEVHEYHAFGEAMARKLLTEIASNPEPKAHLQGG